MAVPAKTIPNRFQLSKVGDKAMDTRIAKFNAYNNGEAITFERIKEFMEHLKEDVGLLPNTLRLYKHSIKQSVLKTFSHQSRDIAFVAKLNQVFAELKIPSYIHPIHEDEILTAKEVKKLITGLSKDGKLKLALVVEFLFSSGCRINEAMNIQVSHIKVKDDVAVIRISHNKQKHEYFKRIPVELYLEIKQVFQTKKYLFQNSRNKPYTNTNYYIGTK
jgi:site-specific recombinase XerD